MTKFKAFGIHFLTSLTLVSLLIAVTLWVWYPHYFANASGVWRALGTVILVDVVLGPLMTLILYKKGKPGLLFDLSLVAVLQIVALAWAVWMLYAQRPVLVVYHDTLMVCLNQQQAKDAGANPQDFVLSEALLPQAVLPKAQTAAQKQARQEMIAASPPGALALPAYLFGKEFKPMNTAALPEVLEDELDLSKIVQSKPEYQQRWEQFIAKHPDTQEQFAFFILACGGEDHFSAVDKKTGVIQDALPLPFLNAIRKHPKS